MAWYIVEAGKSVGPLELPQIERMVIDGRITQGTQVCVVGASEWTVASLDPEIARLLAGVRAAGTIAADDLSAPPSFGSAAAMAASAADPALPPYSYGAVNKIAMQTFKARWRTLVGIGVVWGIIALMIAAPSYFAKLLAQSQPSSGSLALEGIASLMNWGLGFLVGRPLAAGMVVAGARAVRGGGSVGDLFIGFRRYVPVVVANLVETIIMAAGLGVAAVPGVALIMISQDGNPTSTPLTVAGVLLAIAGAVLATLFLVPRVYFMSALAADPCIPREGVGATLSRSWSMTAGKSAGMGGYMILLFVAAGMSIYALCIGLPLIGLPLLVAGLGSVYALVFTGGRASVEG